MLHLIKLYESWKMMRNLQKQDIVSYVASRKNEMMPDVNGRYKVHSVKQVGWCVEVSLINTLNDKNPKRVNINIPVDDWEYSWKDDAVKWTDINSYYEISYMK